jgi:hypothetical protein
MSKAFTGGHWDEPNVLAHMRVNDRKLPSGEKALHVEEWQSDWANELRKNRQLTAEGVPDRPTNFLSPHKPRQESPHPLVDNWQDLMARRTMKEAVDGGYDRVTWVTGEQTAARYDLSKHVEEIALTKRNNGTIDLQVKRIGEPEWDQFGTKRPEEIPSIIGKDRTEKAMKEVEATGFSRIKGPDLKVGGEWAKKLYDESMVNRFNKIGKKYGVQVEDVTVPSAPVVPKTHREYGYEDRLPKVPTTFHSLKITPEMRKAIGATKFHPFADLP